MTNEEILDWLLDSDPSLQYQVYRDLLDEDHPELQARIESEGWGAELLSRRRPDGHWGLSYYQPKWTSSHYTLLELRELCMPRSCVSVKQSIDMIAADEKGADGGINPSGSIAQSDLCINGMFMNFACWFNIAQKELVSIVDFILSQIMPDGGFNCRLNRSGAKHSSLHTTIAVCEGITEYRRCGYLYRLEELKAAEHSSQEFILRHKLFLSDHTGEIIHKDFLRFSYPARWRYDILRTLDYFRHSGFPWDERMQPAVDVLLKKRTKDGVWKLGAKQPGQTHVDYEKPGQPSRWNTLRALRVMKYFSLS